MKIEHVAIWAGLIVVLALSVGCKKPRLAQQHKINVLKGCQVDTKYVTVDRHDTISWYPPADGKSYIAHFEKKPSLPNPDPGTPFTDGNGNPLYNVKVDGAAHEAVGTSGRYLYSLREDGNSTDCLSPTDPGVYIK